MPSLAGKIPAKYAEFGFYLSNNSKEPSVFGHSSLFISLGLQSQKPHQLLPSGPVHEDGIDGRHEFGEFDLRSERGGSIGRIGRLVGLARVHWGMGLPDLPNEFSSEVKDPDLAAPVLETGRSGFKAASTPFSIVLSKPEGVFPHPAWTANDKRTIDPLAQAASNLMAV